MHFVDVERSCKVSGGTTYLLVLAQGLVARRHEFTLAARGGPLAPSFAEAGVTHLRTLFWPLSVPQIAWRLRSRPADIFLCTGRGRARLAALSLAKRHGRPCICMLHDPLKPEQDLPELLRPTALVTVENPIYKAVLALGVPGERVHLWPRPVRCRELAPPPGDGFHVLHIGRLSGQKWQSAANLMEAVPRLLDAIRDLRISIVGGGGKLDAIRALAGELNGKSGKEIVSVVGETLDPLSWMERANLVVAGGYSCLEALYNGRPAIASGFGWIGPVTRHRLLEALDTHFGDRSPTTHTCDQMQEAILEVHGALLDPQRSAEHIPTRDWFPEDHSPEETARRMEALANHLRT